MRRDLEFDSGQKSAPQIASLIGSSLSQLWNVLLPGNGCRVCRDDQFLAMRDTVIFVVILSLIIMVMFALVFFGMP